MAEFPKFPLWTDAYLGDTTHLTTIEHGAYLLLLIAMWRSGTCRLPNNDRLLARYARCTIGQWARIKVVLMPFFKPVGENEITQSRLTDEWLAVRQHSSKQSDKAKARWLKTNGTQNAEALPEASRTDASLSLSLYTPKPPKGGRQKSTQKKALNGTVASPFPPEFPYDHRVPFGENLKALNVWLAARSAAE